MFDSLHVFIFKLNSLCVEAQEWDSGSVRSLVSVLTGLNPRRAGGERMYPLTFLINPRSAGSPDERVALAGLILPLPR